MRDIEAKLVQCFIASAITLLDKKKLQIRPCETNLVKCCMLVLVIFTFTFSV